MHVQLHVLDSCMYVRTTTQFLINMNAACGNTSSARVTFEIWVKKLILDYN